MKILSRCLALLLLHCLFITTSFASKVSIAYEESQETKITNLKNFVDSAIRYVTQKGLTEACKEFNNPKGSFFEGEMYIFVVEYTGKTLAHGGDPATFVGKNISNLKDEFGAPLLLMFVDAAKNGGGTIGYYWKNYAKKGIILFTVSYVKPLDDKTLIGSGYWEDK